MAEERSVRLNKYMAMCGVCSRREADSLIEEGRVTVNGVVAETGVKVVAGTIVVVDGKVLEAPEERVVLAYYKPVGVICTQKDKYAKVTVTEAIGYSKRVTYAGRLDKDSEGLLLMTNDGMLIQQMMRGANGHEKEYEVTYVNQVNAEFIERMKSGVYLEELNATTRPCNIKQIDDYTIGIILTQGLNRQIRRMSHVCGNEVARLKRVRVMNITVNSLEVGAYREIKGDELRMLYTGVGMKLG